MMQQLIQVTVNFQSRRSLCQLLKGHIKGRTNECPNALSLHKDTALRSLEPLGCELSLLGVKIISQTGNLGWWIMFNYATEVYYHVALLATAARKENVTVNSPML